MRNATLALSGLATVAAGVLGGLAADPVPKPPKQSDWREKYRLIGTVSEPEPIVDYGSSGWRGWLNGMSRPQREPAYIVADPGPEMVPAPLEQPLPDDPWAARAGQADSAGQAVAAAVTLTQDIVPAPPQPDSDAPDEVEPDHASPGE